MEHRLIMIWLVVPCVSTAPLVGVGKVCGVAGWVVDTLLGPQGPSPVWLGLILVP